ncbi:MAG: type III secretion system cytoplasmic ring protein SctQ [Archangium sp.]|nr:type III secretion system cytoplasmic ring protein SctQ [Archangium sp.]
MTAKSRDTDERTMMLDTTGTKPTGPGRVSMVSRAHSPSSSRRNWKPFAFTKLEKVSKSHMHLLRGLEWMLPNVRSTGEVSESVRKRLETMLDEKVSLSAEAAHVVHPSNLRRYVGDPTFLAVLAPLPNKTRGLLEVELGLAHMAIDMLLGGSGDAVALRPLTDIEQGVMTYVLIETLKAFAPSLDPALPKLRLESVAQRFEEALAVVGEDEPLAVLQLKAVFGNHSGYVRIFIPETVLSMALPPSDAAVRRQRRSADAEAHIGRLSNVKVWGRFEIGQAEIASTDLAALSGGDVVLVDSLTARPDKGEGGTGWLKVGYGRTARMAVDLALENDRFTATVKEWVSGAPPNDIAPSDVADEDGEHHDGDRELGEGPEELTSPTADLRKASMDNAEGADVLNDIPLQIAVELGRVAMTAEEVVALKVGHVFDLNRSAGEPVDLSVNGKVVARGELVEVDGNLGVRILSLAG